MLRWYRATPRGLTGAACGPQLPRRLADALEGDHLGFLLAGFIAQLGNGFFESLFLKNAGQPWSAIENVIIGPVIAVLSFVCSVGNVPLAAVLWSGGISFGGVLAFLFADLIVLPIIAIYRKYYGTAFAMRITTLMFATMVIAALIVDGLFGVAGLVPTMRPTRGDIFGQVHVDYKLFLNVLGVAIFAAQFWLTSKRGATDPICGMKVDRSKQSPRNSLGRRSTSVPSAACTPSKRRRLPRSSARPPIREARSVVRSITPAGTYRWIPGHPASSSLERRPARRATVSEQE
ncbi:MAG: uncharacterized protein QOH12_1127 [Solirubrobacteraceae bacterium]|nr:uncharacterized protein [Solirubrobacteraceae bacterium]